jgi:hypothetical protein
VMSEVYSGQDEVERKGWMGRRRRMKERSG